MSDSSNHTQKPLQGIRVLEFTQALSGPWCGQFLGGLGAEVIKVEPPQGDKARYVQPFVGSNGVNFGSISGDDMSTQHMGRNRNKKDITLNLKAPEAKDIVFKLVADADVVLENNRPGIMAKLGFGYKDLEKVNPRLIYASLSGFGQEGARSDMKAYDSIIQAMSGIMDVTGAPGEAPSRVGVTFADLSAACMATMGILAALVYRDKTGVGQWIDCSMLDSVVNFVAASEGYDIYARYNKEYRTGGYHHRVPLFCTMPAQDGYVTVTAYTDEDAHNVFRAMGREDMITDERFGENSQRVAHKTELIEILESWSKSQTCAEAVKALTAQGVICTKVFKVGEILSDSELMARKAIVPLINQAVKDQTETAIGSGLPFQFSKTPVAFDSPAPLLGQHNEEIICGMLGYSPEDLEKLKKQGVM